MREEGGCDGKGKKGIEKENVPSYRRRRPVAIQEIGHGSYDGYRALSRVRWGFGASLSTIRERMQSVGACQQLRKMLEFFQMDVFNPS